MGGHRSERLGQLGWIWCTQVRLERYEFLEQRIWIAGHELRRIDVPLQVGAGQAELARRIHHVVDGARVLHLQRQRSIVGPIRRPIETFNMHRCTRLEEQLDHLCHGHCGHIHLLWRFLAARRIRCSCCIEICRCPSCISSLPGWTWWYSYQSTRVAMARLSSSTLLVCSQVKSSSSRPKWPYAAVFE